MVFCDHFADLLAGRIEPLAEALEHDFQKQIEQVGAGRFPNPNLVSITPSVSGLAAKFKVAKRDALS